MLLTKFQGHRSIGSGEDILRFLPYTAWWSCWSCDPTHLYKFSFPFSLGGWSSGAKVQGKLSVPGRPTSLDDSRARAYCTCSRCGWGLFGHFFSHLSFLFSFSLSLGDGPI